MDSIAPLLHTKCSPHFLSICAVLLALVLLDIIKGDLHQSDKTLADEEDDFYHG